MSDPERKVVARYVYTDEQGEPLIRVNRTEPKGFWQQRWDGGEWVNGLLNTTRRDVLYNLPGILTRCPFTDVFVVEGERDAEALIELGCAATTNLGGAGKWSDHLSDYLKGAEVIVIPDLDKPGRDHAAAVVESLQGVAASVTVRLPAVGKDVSDHLNAGLTLTDLLTEDDFAEFEPIDWETYEIKEEEWLFKPYIPVSGRVLLYGKTGSLKSLWAMWVAAKLAEDGRKVAYFSLEMRSSQSAARMKKLNPPKHNFLLLKKLYLDSDRHFQTMVRGLKGYDLIVIDSWNAATSKGASKDQEVADLDNDVFQPLIDATGATLLILDNTGHDVITDKGKFKMDRARGSSAKADKMDVCLLMERPYEDDNYTADLWVKKMRYDFPIPSRARCSTPPDVIDFWRVTDDRLRLAPMWGGTWNVEEGDKADQGLGIPADASDADESSMTLDEKLALARVRDVFRWVKETDDSSAG